VDLVKRLVLHHTFIRLLSLFSIIVLNGSRTFSYRFFEGINRECGFDICAVDPDFFRQLAS
jgi:hypothetical protein